MTWQPRNKRFDSLIWEVWAICVIVWIILFCSVNPAHCQVVDKKFVLVNATLVVATVYDVETTFHALKVCPRCSEANPIMRPFVKRGRVATYAFTGVVNGGLLYWSYTLKKKGSKLWWLIPTEVSLGHGIAGSFNLRF